MVPLLVVPTELTDYTEAYGLIFLESTERIDAARHTTDGTEMIACVAPPLATPCNTPTYNLKYYTSITRTINYTSIIRIIKTPTSPINTNLSNAIHTQWHCIIVVVEIMACAKTITGVG